MERFLVLGQCGQETYQTNVCLSGLSLKFCRNILSELTNVMGIPNSVRMLYKTSDQQLIYYHFKINTDDPPVILYTYGFNLDRLKSIYIRNVCCHNRVLVYRLDCQEHPEFFLHRLSCIVYTVLASREVHQTADVLSTPWAWRNTILCNVNRQNKKEIGLTGNQHLYSKQVEMQ